MSAAVSGQPPPILRPISALDFDRDPGNGDGGDTDRKDELVPSKPEAGAISTKDGAVTVEFGSGNLAKYEVLRAIGKGKFSTVYRAKVKESGQSVALKKIQIFDMVDEKSREKCLKEIKLVKALHHPNIIQYYDAFIEDNELLLVFEYAEAGDLKRQLRKALEREARFDERVIWKYFSQIADGEAVQHMHQRRVMHRDLKPANIFLTLNGTVKVGDLGLGRLFSDATVEAFSKVGTPLYMSPEVLKGKGYEFKSDVWSCGCILYELAMLRSPFKEEGLNLYGLFGKISKGEYPPISEVYSRELRELVDQMLIIDPVKRLDMDDVCAVASKMRIHFTKLREEAVAKEHQAKAVLESESQSTTASPPVETPIITPLPPSNPLPVQSPANHAPSIGSPPHVKSPVPPLAPLPTQISPRSSSPARKLSNPHMRVAVEDAAVMMNTPKLEIVAPSERASAVNTPLGSPEPQQFGKHHVVGPVTVPRVPVIDPSPTNQPKDNTTPPAAVGILASQPRQRPVTPRLTLGKIVMNGNEDGTVEGDGVVAQSNRNSPDIPHAPRDSELLQPPGINRRRVVPQSPSSSPNHASLHVQSPPQPIFNFKPAVVSSMPAHHDAVEDVGFAGVPELPDNVFHLLWSLDERLTLCGYAADFCTDHMNGSVTPLAAIQFLQPSRDSDAPGVKYNQFQHFIQLCRWLLGKIGYDIDVGGPDGMKYSSPQILAAALVVALCNAGCPSRISQNVTPIHLTSGPSFLSTDDDLEGSTIVTCTYRDVAVDRPTTFVHDCFLVKLLPAPIREYKAGWHSVNAPGKARHQFEEVPEDDDALSDGGEEIATDVLAGVAEATSDVKLDDSITGANMDPVEWRKELERVSSKLRAYQLQPSGKGSAYSDWRDRLGHMRTVAASLSFSDTGSESVTLASSLSKIAAECGDAALRVASAEDRIAKDSQFNDLAVTYKHQLRHSSELQSHNSVVAESLTELSSRHASVCDRLENVQEQLAAKSDKVSDTGPVQTIREALADLRREISQLTIRTGVAIQQLTAARQRTQDEKRSRIQERRQSVDSAGPRSSDGSDDSMTDLR